ncbi:hypothetical protein POTOM_057733 [Populus tomentosa]|nr:hypothetical protein POTOM_057733 [Populus tomentosa]
MKRGKQIGQPVRRPKLGVSLQHEYTLLFLEILASLFIFSVFADNSLLASKLERVEGSWFSLILDGIGLLVGTHSIWVLSLGFRALFYALISNSSLQSNHRAISQRKDILEVMTRITFGRVFSIVLKSGLLGGYIQAASSNREAKMPPKFDPSQVVDVYVRVTGGEVGAASSLAPKIGPLGLSPKKIGEDIAKETAKDWKGLRVTVKLTVQNRQAKVTVVPSAAALVIKALKEPERDRKKTKNIKHNGNISLDDVIEIAKVMSVRSMAKDLSGTVKEILGTCVSVGCTVDGKDPKDLQQEITDGDVEISE